MLIKSELLNPNEASLYLAAQGVRRTTSTLAKIRVLGGGPVYRKCNRAILYAKSDLDAWVASLMSPTAASTTAMKAVHSQSPELHLTNSIAA